MAADLEQIVRSLTAFYDCLHQMAHPQHALAHAQDLAADVVVIDHAPGSRVQTR